MSDADFEYDGEPLPSEKRPTTRSSTKQDVGDVRHSLRKLNLSTSNKFLENFNPETSARERRKLVRKLNTSGGKKNVGALYDDNGHLLSTGQDVCDCLLAKCPGCFFPCLKCGSDKCGSECRVNRKYMYEQVDFEGCNISIKNSQGK